MILPCTCTHPFQDAKYGKAMRVHNPRYTADRKREFKGWRCTVCSATKDGPKP